MAGVAARPARSRGSTDEAWRPGARSPVRSGPLGPAQPRPRSAPAWCCATAELHARRGSAAAATRLPRCCGSPGRGRQPRRPHRPAPRSTASPPRRPPLPDPWPARGAATRFVELLCAGHAAIRVIESLDQRGLWVRVLPEWEPCRSRPQRNAYHRFTVDRHLCEAAANAADARRPGRPARPARLGALLHDIGKGYPPGDHTEVGMELVADDRPPHGLRRRRRRPCSCDLVPPPPAAPRRRHPPRPLRRRARSRLVADAVGDRCDAATCSHALTEADSLATGPAAWGAWKAELVRELVDKTGRYLAGVTPPTWTASSRPPGTAR